MQRNTERDRGEKGRITQEGTISDSREEAQERISGLVGEDRKRPLVCKCFYDYSVCIGSCCHVIYVICIYC